MLENSDIHIRPGTRMRDWMDKTSEKFAYRCLPISMANMHGWEILCPESFQAKWSGGIDREEIEIQTRGEKNLCAYSHFGDGILTFTVSAIFRTPPDFNLWIMGVPNQFKDGIQPMTALVETDWIPYTFTMNWKFTRPHHTIKFEKGEPFCFIFPVRRNQLESLNPQIKSIKEDQGLEKMKQVAAVQRQVARSDFLRERFGKALQFQNWYMLGKMPDNSSYVSKHQKKIKLNPFKRFKK